MLYKKSYCETSSADLNWYPLRITYSRELALKNIWTASKSKILFQCVMSIL